MTWAAGDVVVVRQVWHGVVTAAVGHGKLTITPTTGDYAVSHFWRGEDRQFACWYLNIQEPMRSTAIGFDSQDLELDIVVHPDKRWVLKDDDVLEQRVAEGRWTASEVAAIRGIGARIVREVLERDEWWWDLKWADWQPGPTMTAPSFPEGWTETPIAPFAGLVA
jgi:predicted RNA-binding protein associated with RNAse of E/G family